MTTVCTVELRSSAGDAASSAAIAVAPETSVTVPLLDRAGVQWHAVVRFGDVRGDSSGPGGPGEPADPLDGISTSALVDELSRRVRDIDIEYDDQEPVAGEQL